MKIIDCRGLACPAPVITVKGIIEDDHPEFITITVDNEAAQQNVMRFMESQHYEVSSARKNDDFMVTGKLSSREPESQPGDESAGERQKILVMVASDCIGRGDDLLGTRLMINFLKTLSEMGDELWRVVFVNNGVKLTAQESEALPILKELEDRGISLMVCGTCLTHFDLLDRKQVGQTTNMLDIVTALQVADKVINV